MRSCRACVAGAPKHRQRILSVRPGGWSGFGFGFGFGFGSYFDCSRSNIGGMYSLCGDHAGRTRGRSSSRPLFRALKKRPHRLARLLATSGVSR